MKYIGKKEVLAERMNELQAVELVMQDLIRTITNGVKVIMLFIRTDIILGVL